MESLASAMMRRVDWLKRIEAVVVVAGLALGSAGCRWITAKAPGAPLCREGQHVSGDKCCGPGEEWVPARQACLCFQSERCGSSAEAPRRAAEAAPPTGGSPREAAHPCVGAWKSIAADSDGQRVELALAIRPLEPGTLDRPQAASCGTVTERSSEGRCHFRLVRCSQNGDILIATAAASDSSECAESSSVALQCGSAEPRYRRAEEDHSVKGKLERVAATAAAHRAGSAPKP